MSTLIAANVFVDAFLIMSCVVQYNVENYKWATASASLATFNLGLLVGLYLGGVPL